MNTKDFDGLVPGPMGTKDFVALQKQWYKKLKDEGFNDIERTRDVDGKSFDRVLFSDNRRVNQQVLEEGEEYWHMCRSWMHHSQTFKALPAVQQTIWEAYCDGATYRDIVRRVGKPLTSVHHIIQRLRTQALLERGAMWDEPDEDVSASVSMQLAVRRPWHTG